VSKEKLYSYITGSLKARLYLNETHIWCQFRENIYILPHLLISLKTCRRAVVTIL